MGEEKLYDRLLKNAILLCNRGLIDEVSGQNADIYSTSVEPAQQPEFADSLRPQSCSRRLRRKASWSRFLTNVSAAAPAPGFE
jgi:hypothetical protein